MQHTVNTLQPLTTAKAAGYTRTPPIEVDQRRDPVTFLWWATTRAGRVSKFWHSDTFYRLKPTAKLKRTAAGDLQSLFEPSEHFLRSNTELRNLLIERGPVNRQKLPSGYTWHGPYLWVPSQSPHTARQGAESQPKPSPTLAVAQAMAERYLASRTASL